MNSISAQLQVFINDSLSPQKFSGIHITAAEFLKWKNFLAKEIKAIQLSFSNPSYSNQNHEHIGAMITQVVNLSNTLNSYIFKKSSFIKNHPQVNCIKTHYIYSLDLIEELILSLNESFPGQAGSVKISNTNLFEMISGLKRRLPQLAFHLRSFNIEQDLTDIILLGISQLIHKKEITWIDTAYIDSLISCLLNETHSDNQSLTDLLIINDFNLPRFYRYYVNKWKYRLNDTPGLHEQRELLLLEKDRLYNLVTDQGLAMPFNQRSLVTELDEFIKEKHAVAKQLVKLRRKEFKDNKRAKDGIRFLMNLPVPQLGLFIRMQIENGLLAKENIGDLFKFFATHFYTANALFISADSLQKKSTDVEFTTAQKLKGHLIRMLNWLNTNYNLSNYN